MKKLGCLAAIAVCLGGVSLASAQQVQVEGTVSIGQPPPQQGPIYQQAQPPPGYGQPVYQQQQPVYGQQPVYVQQPQPYYVQQQPQQPRYVEREEAITPIWVSGVILFPVSWLLTGLSASQGGGPLDYILFNWIPLVGPWFALGIDEYLNSDEIAGAVAGGILQAGGIVLIILGAVIRRTVQVATYSLGDGPRAPQISFGVGAGELGMTLTHF